MSDPIEVDIKNLSVLHQQMLGEIGKVIVGQRPIVEQLLCTIFAGGHNLLEGVPGLAKTLLISTLSQTMSLNYKRIQFTPDIMPSDIVGTNVIEEDHETGRRETRFVPGPIFTNVILADEINRTPPKTQAALLQAMQEKEVSSGGVTYRLDAPFFVLATQNPIDQEGTYPLPEAQKDRFLMNSLIDYPTLEEEEEVVSRTTSDQSQTVNPVLDSNGLLYYQQLIRRIPVSRHVTGYAVDLVRATRPEEATTSDFIRESVSFGAGPRASQALILCAKTVAALDGRVNVSCNDVRAVAIPVLRHRIAPSFTAEAEGMKTDTIVERILKDVAERTQS